MHLVTRPQPSANKTAAALRRAGQCAVTAPQLHASAKPTRVVDISGYQRLIVTSPQAARALKTWKSLHGLPVLAVGDTTATLLRQSGFKDVTSAQGDVTSVLKQARRYKPKQGGLLLACAPNTGRKLAHDLRTIGFAVRRVSVYAVTPLPSLPAITRKFLQNKKAKSVLFYSPRTARAFVEATEKARLQGCVKTLTAYCLSKAVARAAQELPWKRVVVAAKPNETALLKRINAKEQ